MHHLKRAVAPACLLLWTALLVACAATETRTMQIADLAGTWSLVALDGEPIPDTPRGVTLELTEEGEAGGSTGINRFAAALDRTGIEEGRISFGLGPVTRAAGPPAAMALEQDYLERLGSTSRITLTNGALSLYKNDKEVLKYARARP